MKYLAGLSLIDLLDSYAACVRTLEYGFDYETNVVKTDIIEELARRIG